MTNKEAIFKLIEYRRRLERDFKGFDAESFDMAIKAFEQEPCDDCISRAELLAKIDEERKHLLDLKMDGAEHIVVHHARRIIEDMPSVTPQPKIGRWIFDEILDKHYYCSECKSMGVDYWDYCPNCGAKMEVEE